MRLHLIRKVMAGIAIATLVPGGLCPVLAASGTKVNAPITLSEYLKSGRGTMQLVGDGKDTHDTDLILKSKTSGATTTTRMYTVCASKKTQKTPPAIDTALLDNLEYKLGTAEPEAVCIAKAAEQLDSQKKFDGLLLSEGRRRGAVTQLAIWQYKGQGDPEAEINPTALRSDILKKSQINEKDLGKKQSKELDKSIADIFACVDLTRKLGLSIAEEQKKKDDKQPETPANDNPQIALNGGAPLLVPVSAKDTPNDAGQPDAPPNAGDSQSNRGDSTTAQCPAEVAAGNAVVIPAYTCFEPNNSKYQNMMTLRETIAILPEDGPAADGPQDGSNPFSPGGLVVPGTGGTVIGDDAKPKTAKKKKQCAYQFVSYEKTEFGSGGAGAEKIKDKLKEFVGKAVDWGKQASLVIKAIEKIGPGSGKCDVVLIYQCVVTDPGDEGVAVGTVLSTFTKSLALGTDADATNFQHGSDSDIPGILKKAAADRTAKEKERFVEYAKIFERYRPKGSCCCN